MRHGTLLLPFAVALVACGGGGTDAAHGDAGTGSEDSAGGDHLDARGDAGSTRKGDASKDAVATGDAKTGHDAKTGTDASSPDDSSSPISDAGTAGGPLIQTFVGINGFNWSVPADLSVAGSVREYTNWSWTEGTYVYPHNEDDWYAWSHDAFYANLTDAGLTILPTIQGGVSFVNDGGIPAANGDPTLPASYAAHADHLYQYAARYGSTAVAKNLLKDDAGYTWAFPEPALTGLNEIHYFENGNEDDATWILPGGAPLQSAEEMAAQSSADYDGDQGRMGSTFGVKQADPTAKLVLAGLSQGATTKAETYLQGILDWSKTHRGGSVPFDVINLHVYDFGTSSGISPEAYGLLASIQSFATWRDTNMPGKELWITEFGYDTDPASPLGVPASIGPNSSFIVQGQWIIRSMLAMLQGGVDRAYIYWLNDQTCAYDGGSYCAGQFNTCGLIDPSGNKKASYYMVNAFRSRLATMRYVAPVTSGTTNVNILSFADTAGPGGAYVLWAPTSNATVVSGYDLSVPGAATTAMKVLLEDQQMTGTASTLAIASGHVTVDVSETPTLVLVDHL